MPPPSISQYPRLQVRESGQRHYLVVGNQASGRGDYLTYLTN